MLFDLNYDGCFVKVLSMVTGVGAYECSICGDQSCSLEDSLHIVDVLAIPHPMFVPKPQFLE